MILRGQTRHVPENGGFAERMASVLSDTLEMGQFFCSPKGYIGTTKGGADVRYTDQICVLLGAKTPFILRKMNDHFVLLSDAYVEGLMYGEAIELMQQGTVTVETIDIH